MKTEAKIKTKIETIEERVNELIKDGINNECIYNVVDRYMYAWKALQWALSNARISPDDYEKKIRWEMLCYETSQIF